MAPIVPNSKKTKSVHKRASGLPTVTYAQALDVALCGGGSTTSTQNQALRAVLFCAGRDRVGRAAARARGRIPEAVAYVRPS